MEIAKLILEFLKALAWPFAVLSIAIIFRAPISAILSRLRKADLPCPFGNRPLTAWLAYGGMGSWFHFRAIFFR